MTASMDLKPPRAVIFDWDNTLVDVWDCVTDAVNHVRSAFGQEPWSNEIVKSHSPRSTRVLFPEWYGDRWREAYDLFYDRYHQSHLSRLKALPGAHELLQWLADKNIPSHVVSNKRGDDLRSEIAHLGWNGLFSAVVGSMDAPRDKPERDPVDLALGQTGLKADDPAIWFVGDTYGDVHCARNAGCTPVFVGNPEEAKRLNVELAFSDCFEILEMLCTFNASQTIHTPVSAIIVR